MSKYIAVYITKVGNEIEKICSLISFIEYESVFRLNIDMHEDHAKKGLLKRLSQLPMLLFVGEEYYWDSLQEYFIKYGCETDKKDIPASQILEIFKSKYQQGDLEEYSVVDYFKETLGYWYGKTNNSDCMTYYKHRENNNSEYPAYRLSFGIPVDEEILFTRDTSSWNDKNEGLVISENAIYFRPYSEVYALKWTDISRVSYKEYCFYFEDNNGKEVLEIYSKYFFKKIDNEELEGYIGDLLALNLSNMAYLAGDAISIYNEVLELESTQNYDEAISKIDELLTDKTVNNYALAHFFKGRLLVKKELTIDDDGSEKRFNDIEKEFDKASELSDNLDMRLTCNYWLSYCYREYGRNYDARNLLMSAMDAESEDIRENAKEQFLALEGQMGEFWNNFTSEYDYKDRKFIMPINDNQIAGCWAENVDTFRMSNIPSCIKFPVGHPLAGELYIGHPYNSSVYVPYEGSEDVFFVDKIHELCYLLQCLGAEEISITSIKGKSIDELNNADATVGGNANIKAASLSGEYVHSASVERNTSSNIQRTISQKFDPMQKPYVPEGLIWFPEQTKWQRLVDSRLNGNLLEYSEFVSTSDTKFVSSSERTTIKASAEYLWAKIDGNAELKSESQFKESVETQWKVEVKFRSIKQFVEESAERTNASNLSKGSAKLTTNEQEYIDSLKDFLEDDAEITPHERKMLDRIRQKLGISEERAAELETSLKPQLTEDEQEYLEMYHEYEAKGEITEKERRRLEKFAGALNIPSNRIIELENL